MGFCSSNVIEPLPPSPTSGHSLSHPILITHCTPAIAQTAAIPLAVRRRGGNIGSNAASSAISSSAKLNILHPLDLGAPEAQVGCNLSTGSARVEKVGDALEATQNCLSIGSIAAE